MTIAFIATNRSSPTGGSEELWTKAALEAFNEGHTVICMVYNWNRQHPIVEELANQGVLLVKRLLRGKHQSLVHRGILKLRHLVLSKLLGPDYELSKLLKHRPDVICISQASSYDVSYGPEFKAFIQKMDIPFVLIAHSYLDNGLISGQHLENARFIYPKASKVFYVAEKQRRTIEKQLMCKLHNAEKVLNPLNLSSREKSIWRNDSILKFAMVGALVTRWKGQDIALEALSSPEWKSREWTLDIYGSGDDESLIQDLIEFYGLSEKVTLKGFEPDVRKIWKEHDVLLMPSRVEAAPLVLNEAILCGRVPVVTDIGDMALTVKDGVTGFVSPAPEAIFFRAALERLWEKRHDLHSMADFGYEEMQSAYHEKPERMLLSKLLF